MVCLCALLLCRQRGTVLSLKALRGKQPGWWTVMRRPEAFGLLSAGLWCCFLVLPYFAVAVVGTCMALLASAALSILFWAIRWDWALVGRAALGVATFVGVCVAGVLLEVGEGELVNPIRKQQALSTALAEVRQQRLPPSARDVKIIMGGNWFARSVSLSFTGEPREADAWLSKAKRTLAAYPGSGHPVVSLHREGTRIFLKLDY